MIELEKHVLPEVVDWKEVEGFKLKIQSKKFDNVPVEVEQFIKAIDNKLGDFAKYGVENVAIKGSELLACGIKQWDGEHIFSFAVYAMKVPKMLAVDNYTAMHRIFFRKGKQGLIDFCKSKVKASELERVLSILSLEVFHEHRPEFKMMMANIEASKKIEPIISA